MSGLLQALLHASPLTAVASWTFAWLLVLVSPLLAWVLAFALAPDGGNGRWRRGAGAMAGGALLSLMLLPLLRLFVYLLATAMGWSPAGWFEALLPLPAPGWDLAVILVILALGHAALWLPLSLIPTLMNRLRRRERPERVEGGGLLAPGLALSAVGMAILLPWGQLGHGPAAPHLLLDLLAALPLTTLCLGIWTLSAWEPRQLKERAPQPLPAPAPSGPDVVGIWRQLGALGASEEPFLRFEGRPAAPGGELATRLAWRQAGAEGPPPKALDALAAAWQDPWQGWLVPDLADPTERLFLTAAITLAIHEQGLPCLAITEDPRGLRDAVDRAMQASGTWSCGPLVAGEEELRGAFAGGRMPAAAFLDVAELSAEGIRALAGDPSGHGATWCRNLGLVLLSRIDRGSPLTVTHRLFTVMRLGLAMRGIEARWSVLATGFGGERTMALLERAFPGFATHEVPLEPRAAAPVRVWLVPPSFRAAPGRLWARAAVEPVVKTGVAAAVGDPPGAFGLSGLQVWGGDVRLSRDLTLAGQASVSELDEAWLVAAWRALPHRPPLPDGQAHECLWGLPDNPVVGFLTRDRNLEGLHHHGLLLPPRPLVGADNRLVAQTHLQAALRECAQDLPSLRDAFGDSLVESTLEPGFEARNHGVRRRSANGRLARLPLGPALADTEARPLRATVTSRVVSIVHGAAGERLALVDALCAPTRYYPGRVFAVGERRYRVPAQSYDMRRAQILVEPVPAAHPLTLPELGVKVSQAVVIEAPQQTTHERLRFRLATFEVMVTERVTGHRAADGAEQRYAEPVETSYPSRARGIFFDEAAEDTAWFHLARALDSVLLAHVFATDEDLEVHPVRPGLAPGLPAGILAVDRHVQGMGLSEAMSPLMVREALRWVAAILGRCACAYGCAKCTPMEVLRVGPDKGGVLRLLGHR